MQIILVFTPPTLYYEDVVRLANITFFRRPLMMMLLKLILAVFLPPVSAFLQVGLGLHFWINIILTILGVVPGMVHAFWLVLIDKK